MLNTLGPGALMLLLFAAPLHAALPGDYEQALQAYQTRSAGRSDFSADEQAVMQRAKAALARSLPDPGIKVGERAPDFTLPNAFGEPVHLYDALKNGPVVLVFYRGAWCPYCNLHLRALRERLPQFKALGAQLIAVTPQTPDKSLEQFKAEPREFDVLSDLDSSVMQAYRLIYEVDPDLAEVYRKHGLDLIEYNGPGRNVLPAPGTFVIDRNGMVRAMQADTDYTKRMEPAEVVHALETIQSEVLRNPSQPSQGKGK
ncbi:peroxiredoxin-like family protein [Thiobacillus sp.]|uniref:peroxiredoxin-like family protein n=1 Tax=Thiobacillus sp. TaxID=924 RepID=UPI0011D844D0|nr:peroxiredoxin-like family protein [Thiobacillus sp.]TXH74001.1 MAG: AhpC/TSA family protein [Thiobacillus sp.]